MIPTLQMLRARSLISSWPEEWEAGRHWSVGIQHPRQRAHIAAVVRANDFAVATSGAYARGDHVLNPYTRRPPEGVLSVTVVGGDLARADAYAVEISCTPASV